jgi:hypothetical protein
VILGHIAQYYVFFGCFRPPPTNFLRYHEEKGFYGEIANILCEARLTSVNDDTGKHSIMAATIYAWRGKFRQMISSAHSQVAEKANRLLSDAFPQGNYDTVPRKLKHCRILPHPSTLRGQANCHRLLRSRLSGKFNLVFSLCAKTLRGSRAVKDWWAHFGAFQYCNYCP